MYHSLSFQMLPSRGSGSISFNTYTDLYLVPTSRPTITPPAVNTKSIEIPGANGSLDLTESITPYPTYKDRTGSIDFAVLNDRMPWNELYSKIMNYIHGRRGKMILEDDPDWYYEGRWAVNNWSPGTGDWSTVSLDYTLSPYKLSNDISLDGDWDYTTNLTDDGAFNNIQINSSSWTKYGVLKNSSYELDRSITGWMPIIPELDISANGIGIKVVNDELGYTYEKTFTRTGVQTDPELILYDWLGDGYELFLKGNGTVSMGFRRGSL